ncbi:hypothetical protein COOONC_25973 [Cooperia oncophora]
MSKQINKVTSRRMHAKPSEDSKGEIKDAEKEDVLKKKKEKRKTSTKEEEEYTDFEEVDAPMKPAVVEILSKEKQVGVFPGDLPPYDNPTIQPVSNDRNHSEEVNKGADSTMNISKISQASESGRAETQPKSESKTADTCRTALATSRDGFEFLVSSEFCNCEKYETGGKSKPPSSRRHHVHRNVEVLKMSKEGMEFLLSSEPLQLNSEQPALHASSKSPLPSKSLHSEMSTASDGAAQSPAENSEPKVHNVSDQGITPAESAPEEKTNPPRKKQKILQPKACAEVSTTLYISLNELVSVFSSDHSITRANLLA